MTNVFVASRLQMARSLRGMTATALARSAAVTPEWLSKVERGHTTPSGELVARLAQAIDLPSAFLFRESTPLPGTDAFHFRASSKLAQKDEASARALASLACDLSDWMDQTYRLPAPGIPDIQELTGADLSAGPEIAAEALRNHWALGEAPISNMVGLLESKGGRVFSASGSFRAIDAFSFRHGTSAIIFLNPTKSAERLRFDLAHELGHLLLHGGSLYEDDGKARERQANDFASAFLMPRGGILGSLRGNADVEAVLRLRSEWKVSAMAVAVRLHQLGVSSDWTYRLMCQELARRGYRRGEPGSRLIAESSTLWPQVLADLGERGRAFASLSDLLGVRTSDVQSLLVGLVPMALPGGSVQSARSSADLRLVGPQTA